MSAPSSSEPRHPCTRHVRPRLALVQEPWSGRRLFVHHFDEIRRLYQSADEGYLVVAMNANRSFIGGVAVLAGAHVTVGRHQQADLVLESDPSAALRHVLVRVGASPHGPVAKLFDLRTSAKLEIDGEGTCEAAVADGDVLLRIGQHAIMLLKVLPDEPSWGEEPEVIWEGRPRAAVHKISKAEASPLAAKWRRRREWPARRVSTVTCVPGLVPSSRLPSSRLPSSRSPSSRVLSDEPAPPDVMATASLVLDDDSEIVLGLSAEVLRRGVLLGRYSRCEIALDMWSGNFVSRVHAVLLADDDGVTLLDTASLAGIKVDGRRVRSAALGKSNLIELSRDRVIRWRWLSAPE